MSDTTSPENLNVPRKKATFRLGQRELTYITRFVVLLFVIPALFFGYRAYLNFKAKRDIVIATTNLRAIHQALKAYALDNNGRLPTADHWTETALGWLSAPPRTPGGKESLLHGPGDQGNISYVYNDLAGNFSLEPTDKPEDSKIEASKLVLLIERVGAEMNAHISIPAQVDAASESKLKEQLQFNHYADDELNATTVILYADGKVETRSKRDFR